MSKLKTVLIFLSIVIFELMLTVSPVLALDSCTLSGIEYEPKFVPENSGDINFQFFIKNLNTLTNILNKQVKLHFDKGWGPWDDWASQPTTITDKSFSIVVGDQDLLKRGRHKARLKWKADPNKDFEDFCSNITYQVGAPSKCIIDPLLPKKIPPNSSLTIKFLGKANTNYQLRFNSKASGVADITTDNQGQGEFSNISIPGNNGDTATLQIVDLARSVYACETSVTISIGATTPIPPSPSPGPIILPPSPGITGLPSIAGGTQCGVIPNDPAIATAIGCIHTSPVGFVKDFLKFALGIAGGLAFLLMLLGAFQMITSAGNPDTLAAGKDRLTNAVIGLLFVIFAVLLLQIIGVDILGIEGFGR